MTSLINTPEKLTDEEFESLPWILSCQKNDRGCKLNFRFNFCATGLVTHEKIALQFQMFAVWNCGLK